MFRLLGFGSVQQITPSDLEKTMALLSNLIPKGARPFEDKESLQSLLFEDPRADPDWEFGEDKSLLFENDMFSTFRVQGFPKSGAKEIETFLIITPHIITCEAENSQDAHLISLPNFPLDKIASFEQFAHDHGLTLPGFFTMEVFTTLWNLD